MEYRKPVPVIPIIPGSPVRPVLADEFVVAQTEVSNLAGDISLFARVLRRADGGRRVAAIFALSIVITIANMYGQVRLNEWNGQFFDAVGCKDLSDFVRHIWTFLVIIAFLLTITAAQTFLQERLKFRLREWIPLHLLAEWLKPLRVSTRLRGTVRSKSRSADSRGYAPAWRLYR